MANRLGARSITFKMSLYMSLLIVFLMAAVGCGNYYNSRETLRIQVLEKGWGIVRSGSAFAAEHLQTGNPNLLQEHLENIRANDDVSFAAIISASGKIVAHTDKKQIGNNINFAEGTPTVRSADGYTDFLSPIITNGGSTIGFFRLGLDNSRYQLLLQDIIIKMVLLSFAAVVAGIMLARVMAGRILKKPIGDLMSATEHIAAGDFAHHVPVRHMDELGSLAIAFNSMTGHLANLFMSVRTSASELTRSSQLILSRSEDFKRAVEEACRKEDGKEESPAGPDAENKKQMEALEEITFSARKMARLVDRLNSLSLQFKL
ncbi:MAG: HAMP domain-containing protein [Actinobacteria bacterium]|nr:HAMP domain-containing protein [Actinomycetota bacterium]